MTKIAKFFFVFAILLSFNAPANAEPGWCSALAEKDPRAAFGLIAEFSLQLAAQRREGSINQEEFDQTHLGIRDANLNFAKGDFNAGCEILERLQIERRFDLALVQP